MDKVTINHQDLPANLYTFFRNELVKRFGINLEQANENPLIKFSKLQNVIEDSYSITVKKDIRIAYSSDASLFYALNSLFQLITIEDGLLSVKECFIHDHPKFKWRGMHLDVSRHFFTVEEVKRYIDLMSYYKFNTFHWHLTDDQGWRIEIKKYPLLTDIGAWRDSTVENHYGTVPRTYKKERYGGYYTQEEIKEVVAYAASKYVTVVPEIEMPGHSRALLAAYPELSCTRENLPVPGLWGVFDDILCSRPSSIQFMKDILDEVLELFPSDYIHIGGDEAPKTRWKECPDCQKVIKDNQLKDEHELQSYFIRQIDEYLTNKGRKLIGWDEILEGGLSPNAAVMSWRGTEGGIAAAKEEHFVVMTPGSHCYFDHYQSRFTGEPLAIGGFTSLEKVYSFNPIPEELTATEAHYILGGQANVWTEYIPDFKHIEYMVYPRAIALAQALWSHNLPDYLTFEKVLNEQHLPFLQQLDINYSRAHLYPELKFAPTNCGIEIQLLSKETSEKLVVNTYLGKKLVQTIDNPTDWRFELNRRQNLDTARIDILIGEHNPTVKQLNLIQHSSIGFPVELMTMPHERFSGQSGFTLVDGKMGSIPWKGNEWLGFQSDTIIFEIDLLKLRKVRSFYLHCLADEGSWIYQPKEIRVSSSRNGKKWNRSLKTTYRTNGVIRYRSKAKKLRVTVISNTKIEEGKAGEGNKPWTFLGELMIDYK